MNVHRSVSRRHFVMTSAIAGLSTAVGFPLLTTRISQAATRHAADDAEILNKALFYEHQAIWAYTTAASKLSETAVGKAVKTIALQNQADHKAHRDALAATVKSLGGMPVGPQNSYDSSSYLERGEGGLDSDVNIAKLALALETDAAIAYTTEIAHLKTPELITAGASIGSNEAAHATAIRSAFVALGLEIPTVPAAFVAASTREAWIVKV